MRRAFLIRFDDVCPTMNWDVWQGIETILRRADVKPIVAIVPDNRHESLIVGPPLETFWDRAKVWQDLGWSIGLHGYQHSAVTTDGGLLDLNDWSEFAGLDHATQRAKISAGLKIFERQGLRPDVWVAPGHSFDDVTLSILPKAGLTTISDGFSTAPYRDRSGMLWVPQQLWRLRNVPFGVWTVAFHVNRWTDEDVARFDEDIRRFRPWISDLPTVIKDHGGRSQGAIDRAFAWMYRAAVVRRRKLELRSSSQKAGSGRGDQG